MCFSHNFIEQQAFEMCEKIREHSIYHFVRVEFKEGISVGVQKYNDYLTGHKETTAIGLALITKIILKDNEGICYAVEPSLNGLRFAKGEITYKEYKKLQKREDFYGYTSFLAIIGFFSLFLIVMRFYFER